MANRTTVQALKILASWTPNAATAAAMAGTFGEVAKGVAITGGRLTLKHSIQADYADPDYTAKVTARAAAIKAALGQLGTVYSFDLTAGAVPAGSAENLHEPPPPADEQQSSGPAAPADINDAGQVAAAVEAGWLPDGWSQHETEPGVVIVPDSAFDEDGRVHPFSGASSALAYFRDVRTTDGRSLKTNLTPAAAAPPAKAKGRGGKSAAA